MDNPIVIENQKPGTPRTVWDVPSSNQIEGFATDFSVDNGSTVSFKINLNVSQGATAPYRIEIYRLGYYGGDGATLVTTLNGLTGIRQPDPITDSRGLVDAGNWSVGASWTTPADAVSGVYLAKLVRTDNGATNQIPFIVRDDGGTSDILLQTSDTTWQAYNGWGGRNGQVGGSLYGGFDQPANIAPDQNPLDQDRAFAVSYNRPFITRNGGGTYAGGQDYLFGADYAALYWLEKNGYSVSYISGVDTDRLGASYLTSHKAFISVGHDEYWSGPQRANVEAARDAGVNLLFWSGNEVYWKTRWESSIVDGAAYRTLVSYKETKFNYSTTATAQDYPNVDPSNEWTGTWRDLRFVNAVGSDGVTHTAVGARPENTLTGQLFGPDGTGEFGGALDIPAAYAGLRVWRNTSVGPNGALDIAPGILGYEWDTSPVDAFRPAGLIKLSETTIPWGEILTDQGNRTAPGTATHSLSLYRAPSGALVFGAGTVFWSWGLSNQHDSSPYGANIQSATLQQFTVNMFADMGIQPGVADAILQSQGLVRALASNDRIAATTTLNNLPDSVGDFSQVTISGSAADIDNDPSNDDGRVALVEVSVDGGLNWRVAQGTANWSYSWTPTAQGTYTIKARAIDDSLNIRPTNQLATDVVTVTAPQTPDTVSLFGSSVTPTGQLYNDGQAVELGVKFQATQGGAITSLRYFRAAGDSSDTDQRQGHLWAANGTLLATVTFNSAPGQSGWQVATLATPVTIQAGALYIASYKTANNYLAADNYFSTTYSEPFGVLSAPASGQVGGNGVYAYGASVQFPNQTYNAGNYWVDVVFDPPNGGNAPPTASPINAGVSNEDAPPLSINLLATATDPEGQPLSVQNLTVASSNASRAVVFSLSSGVLTLTPSQFNDLAQGAFETITASYRVSDGVNTTPNTATLRMDGRNDAPVAGDDAFATGKAVVLTGNVITNLAGLDRDPDGNTLSVVALNGGASGVGTAVLLASGARLTLNASGAFTYDPNGAFDTLASGQQATDSFAYTVSDGLVGDIAAVTITINGAAGLVLTGTKGADTLTGGSGDDTLRGLGGSDQLFGNGGRDTLDGGSGTDRVDGGSGDDVLWIRAAEGQFDMLIGGDGTDTLRVNPAGGVVTLDSTANISTIEVFDGAGQAVRGSATANTLDFSAFASVVGVASISGQGGDDILTGSSGRDVINGGTGADQLNGGAGDDLLNGGAGADRLTGGGGADTFVYLAFGESSSSARDVLVGFEGAGVAGGDLIDVSALSSGQFAFNGTGGFSGGGVASISYTTSGGVTDVQFDNGNGGAAEMVVRLDGLYALSAGDFIL